jgi:radical SAM enzyme (TIGR01210 family)
MTALVGIGYPERAAARDAWIVARRPPRKELDPARPYAFFVEEECSASGEVVPVATIFLTNRECPWRCLMCDLWQNTLTESVPVRAIPAQIDYALERLPPARQIKLYNSGSFFDTRAIPPEDYPRIVERVAGFERVIVECHPALVGESCFRFGDSLRGRLEVAMGLETAHPEVLERLNKRMTLEQFAAAAGKLRRYQIDLRVFILVKPPFMKEDEALEWARRSLDFAFECGATAATLIPTRGGNGALDELARMGEFAPPRLATVEAAAEYGISLGRGRVFVDLWDAGKAAGCAECCGRRVERLAAMNLRQMVLEPVYCEICGVGS